MKKNFETILDENGIEIAVGYLYEKSESQIEEGHGYHEVGNMVYTELEYVEVIIGGVGVDILHLLNEKQKESIIELLQYD